jgi:hypothetical protein
LDEIKEGDQGTAARACQRIEVSLIIGEAVERFSEDRSNLPVQAIHDSVIVFSPNAVAFGRAAILGVSGSIGSTRDSKGRPSP